MMRRGLGLFVLAVAMAGCGDDSDPPRATPTATPPVAVTATATTAPTTVGAPPTASVPPSVTPAAATFTATPLDSATPTITFTPSLTPTPVPPQLVFFGVARADDLVQGPDGVDAEGRPIFVRSQGQGMTLIVEGRHGGARLSDSAYDPVGFAPGVEIIASRPLGDGSPAVCDYDPPIIGGVPGVDPPEFRDDQMVRDAVADLGCRFNDGTGAPLGRNANNACTRDAGALFSFVDPGAELQYCLPIAKSWSFPAGDTIVAARVRDLAGQVSEVREIVIRVSGDVPFDCDSGLGERAFTAQTPASRLVIAGQDGPVSGEPWVTSPLRLCAGPDLGNGTHPVTLREDALFGIPLTDGEVLCVLFHARGSDGVLDCGNSAAQDVYASAEQANGRVSVDTGLGVAAGTGSASLRLPVSFRLLSAGSTVEDCLSEGYGSAISDAFTTASATAEVLDEHGAAVASLTRIGSPFSCSDWLGGSPVLVMPIPATDPIAGSVAAALVLVE